MQNSIYNHTQLKQRRRNLRRQQTDYETALWHQLRNQRFCGLKFYRQYGVGPYILDFFCPQIRLGIEIDGEHHQWEDVKNRDQIRTSFLKNQDITIVRFKNSDVFNNLQGLLYKLKLTRSALGGPPSLTLREGAPPLDARGGSPEGTGGVDSQNQRSL